MHYNVLVFREKCNCHKEVIYNPLRTYRIPGWSVCVYCENNDVFCEIDIWGYGCNFAATNEIKDNWIINNKTNIYARNNSRSETDNSNNYLKRRGMPANT